MIVFGVGVAVTLAWQTHGDAAREMIANAYPELGWLAPQQEALAETAPEIAAPPAPAAPSPDAEQIKAILLGLAAVRQSVDKVAADQQQMASEIAKLQAADQEILSKLSAPPPPPRPAVAASARKPVSLTPPDGSSR